MNQPQPQAIEAECSVLGACLMHQQAVHIATQSLTAEDFFAPKHAEIFRAISAVSRQGGQIDTVNVADYLLKHGKADAAGGISYVSSLTDSVIGWAGTKSHCAIVRAKFIARAAISTAQQLIGECYQGDAQQAIEWFGVEISKLNRSGKYEPKAIANITGKVIDQIESVLNGTANYGIQTGFVDIDRRIVGMAPGDLIVLAARPSMGKTALALNIADHVASQGIVAMVFSMEMGDAQLAMRLLSAHSGVPGDCLRKGNITDPMLQQIHTARQRIDSLPLIIHEEPALSISKLQSIARFQHMKNQIGLVVVDYIQLMNAEVGKGNREQEISTITRGLKALAKELVCPVLALSQLNRSLESRTDKRPIMSDLRESGAIEQDADVIMFIYRNEVYNRAEDNPDKGIAEVITAKQRQGSTGVDRLLFRGEVSRFENFSRAY